MPAFQCGTCSEHFRACTTLHKFFVRIIALPKSSLLLSSFFHPVPFHLSFSPIPSLHPTSLLVIIIIIQARGPIYFLLIRLVDHLYLSHPSIHRAFLSSSSSFLTKIPTYTTANVDITYPSLPDVAAIQIVTTNANCSHPSLSPFQSRTTDPSPPSIDNEEVVILVSSS